jgi:hypothetical protein
MTNKLPDDTSILVGRPIFCLKQNCTRPPRPFGVFVLTKEGSAAVSPCAIHSGVLMDYIEALAEAERTEKEKKED